MTAVSLIRDARRVGGWVMAFAMLAAPLAAQTRFGAISGVVKDDNGLPIPNVEVAAPKVATVARTDSVGKFVLGSLPPGEVDITFRRLAFAPVVLMIQVPPDDTTEVEVKLTVVAQKLTGVVVQAHSEHLRELVAFESRRKQGIGHFITRAQIEKRNPGLLSDMFRMIPGAIIIPDGGRTALRFARTGRNGCPPQFFIDGTQVTGFNVDDMPVSDVEGVEIYAGPSGLPPNTTRPVVR